MAPSALSNDNFAKLRPMVTVHMDEAIMYFTEQLGMEISELVLYLKIAILLVSISLSVLLIGLMLICLYANCKKYNRPEPEGKNYRYSDPSRAPDYYRTPPPNPRPLSASSSIPAEYTPTSDEKKPLAYLASGYNHGSHYSEVPRDDDL